MLPRLLALVARVLLETAVLLGVCALLLALLAFRLGRGFLRDRPGGLERLTAAGVPWPLEAFLRAVEALAAQRASGVESPEP